MQKNKHLSKKILMWVTLLTYSVLCFSNTLLELEFNALETSSYSCQSLSTSELDFFSELDIPSHLRISTFINTPNEELFDLLKIITRRKTNILIENEIAEFILTTDDYTDSTNMLLNYSSFMIDKKTTPEFQSINNTHIVLAIHFNEEHWPFKQLFFYYYDSKNTWKKIVQVCDAALSKNIISKLPDNPQDHVMLLKIPTHWEALSITLELIKKPTTYILNYEKPKLINSIQAFRVTK